ncbi:endo-alpha-N-acetylgalactosaminidase family protein [Mammaliicoccus sciuri]|uniref:endo-alpha-N-acetylgalactosaminidase family protein n=1 Tax=Mammaliicoccus sciuri TaxID=1296 RepID=UPI0023B94368|nr:endo-alpha-N-acetylgalactosaminidase family protein [Mammaliicoccus sciuri]
MNLSNKTFVWRKKLFVVSIVSVMLLSLFTLMNHHVEAKVKGDVLKSNKMKVKVDKSFPRAIEYTLKNGKKMDGQVKEIKTIKVNGKSVQPKVKYKKINAHAAQYQLIASNKDKKIDAEFTIEMKVKDNQLHFDMKDYQNKLDGKSDDTVIKDFEIPNHSLVSVNSKQKNANLQTTRMSTNTMKSGDKNFKVNKDIEDGFNYPMMYGFVSNDKTSAGVWSNSQHSEGTGELDYTRINATSKQVDKDKYVGLSSSKWILQPGQSYENAKEQHLMPKTKVVITDDENGDGKTDWQDGAIAYRAIMNHPTGSESVPDLVAHRIAMNFGSQAQNPFLKSLDGVKKVNLNTDGLGQSIILKGYGSEGHDSGHLDYDNIGQRIGGVEDMKKLLKNGKKYGAKFGVHINASETYPESKAFNPDRLRKNEDGTYNYGWNWLDQGINIDAKYDMLHGRKDRLNAFKDKVGKDLNFIYVDVWGNGQSGDNQAWMSHQLAKEIQDLGWRVAVEWGHGMEYDSTFQHWAADLTYGGYENKGINSKVARFIRNHEKDSWVGNYQTYSGAADYPLLGGYDMKDFEGWQGRNNFDEYINNIFKTNLSTKYLQHFEVTKWVDGKPVKMTANDQTVDWTPEMEIQLKNGKDKIVIKRKSNDYENDKENYRSRTITLNGQKILDGNKYLIPWNWDENGKQLSSKKQKLYHYNEDGGESTWELPKGWNSKHLKLYQLTEHGRQYVDNVRVKDGKVTLSNVKANTPYVLYKSKQHKEKVKYGEDMHIKDPGFNAENLKDWKIKGSKKAVSITKSNSSDNMLMINNPKKNVELKQKLTDLKPGKQYAVYVGVDNRSDHKARIRVDADGTTHQNYTTKSIAKNYVKANAHNTTKESATKGNDSYFQNMYVHFKAPKNGKAILTISRDKGEGLTYFDDIRIFVNDQQLYSQDKVFKQNFEKVPQGIFPFVVSDIEGVEDNRTHLSEKHAPYTQRGWNNKRISDVIDGTWSLKINGQVEKNKLAYQTIPQNFRFEPNKTYEVSFEYEAGSDDTYAFATGSDSIDNQKYKETPLKGTVESKKHRQFKTKIKGHKNGQTWIGIASTDKKADNKGVKNEGQVNFEGTKDFVLDNLVIKEVKED